MVFKIVTNLTTPSTAYATYVYTCSFKLQVSGIVAQWRHRVHWFDKVFYFVKINVSSLRSDLKKSFQYFVADHLSALNIYRKYFKIMLNLKNTFVRFISYMPLYQYIVATEFVRGKTSHDYDISKLNVRGLYSQSRSTTTSIIISSSVLKQRFLPTTNQQDILQCQYYTNLSFMKVLLIIPYLFCLLSNFSAYDRTVRCKH